MSLQIPDQLRQSKFSPHPSSKESIFIPSRNISIISRRHLNIFEPSVQNTLTKTKGSIMTMESRSRAQSQERRPEKKELDIGSFTQDELMEVF